MAYTRISDRNRDLEGRWCVVPQYADKAYQLTQAIERSIARLNLDSQGEFVSLTNAIEMQIDSGAPVEGVVRLLADAILALAVARRLPEERLRLHQRLDAVVECAARLARHVGKR